MIILRTLNFVIQSDNNKYESAIELAASQYLPIYLGGVTYYIAALIAILFLIFVFKSIKYLNLKIKIMKNELKKFQ